MEQPVKQGRTAEVDGSHSVGTEVSGAEVNGAEVNGAEVDSAIERTVDYLMRHQAADGHWCGELEGDSLLQSEYILLQAFLHGPDLPDEAHAAADTILRQQEPSGGWALFPGGDLDISASVKAYFALKLTGHDADSPPMIRAREAIRNAGGADQVNSFTRFFLALLGQISYDLCPAVAPEVMLLPSWAPLNIYRISAWSRTILVPLSIVWAHRPVRQPPENCGVTELFLKPPNQWPALRRPGAEANRTWSWETAFRGLDWLLKRLERWRITPARRVALRRAQQWITERFASSDGLGAIFPPIVWSRIALKCLGQTASDPDVVECDRQLDQLIIQDDQGLRLQPCKSPVWDTANSLRALAAAGLTVADPAVARAVRWLLDREVNVKGDWTTRVNTPPAGWFFEYNNAFYPDIDDTIMVMMAFRELGADQTGKPHSVIPDPRANQEAEAAANRDTVTANHGAVTRLSTTVAQACERARRWVLAFQNRDGGWGAFDKDNDAAFLCEAPFADHNAMIDPSTPDIAARVVEALAKCSMTRTDTPLNRAIRYVVESQETNGSWYGRWGVNYIYGTWQALVGLAAIGLPTTHPAIRAGRQWLLDHQQPSGGWGESPKSYSDESFHGIGEPTASQTAWALLGLLATGPADDPAVLQGVHFLLRTQTAGGEGDADVDRQSVGSWAEPEFTGTGFPLVFYLRYHMYSTYFPLMALGQWRARIKDPSTSPTTASQTSHGAQTRHNSDATRDAG